MPFDSNFTDVDKQAIWDMLTPSQGNQPQPNLSNSIANNGVGAVDSSTKGNTTTPVEASPDQDAMLKQSIISRLQQRAAGPSGFFRRLFSSPDAEQARQKAWALQQYLQAQGSPADQAKMALLQQQQAGMQSRQEAADKLAGRRYDIEGVRLKIAEAQERRAQQQLSQQMKREQVWAQLAENIEDPEERAQFLHWSQDREQFGIQVPMPNITSWKKGMKIKLPTPAGTASTGTGQPAATGGSVWDTIKGFLGGGKPQTGAEEEPKHAPAKLDAKAAQWLTRARQVNPGVSDAELLDFYKKNK